MAVVFWLIPYILLFVVALLNLKKNTKSSNNWAFFILVVFSALRYEVGYDYYSYYEIIDLGAGIERFEPLEQILCIISVILQRPQLFFAVNSVATIYFLKGALRRLNVDQSKAYFLFLCLPLMFLNSLSVVRFWTSVSIVFYASTFLKEKKYIAYFIFLCLGFLCHKAALLGFLFFPLSMLKLRRSSNVIILIFAVLISIIAPTLLSSINIEGSSLSDDYQHYVQKDDNAGGMSKIPYFYALLDCVILLCGYHRMSEEDKQNTTIFNVGVALIFAFSFNATLSARLSRYFLIYALAVFPKMLYGKYRQVTIFCSFVIYVYLLTIYSDSLNGYEYLPYQIFFIK